MIQFPMDELARSRERLLSEDDPYAQPDDDEHEVGSVPAKLPWYRRWLPKRRPRR